MKDVESDATGQPVLRVTEGIKGFAPADWAKLFSTAKAGTGGQYNPFVSHAFLSALEDSGCVGETSGWIPRFLRLEDGAGELLGATPSYIKFHSQGEYVFDHGWADAFERAGGQYYPKLQVSIPFTPATGPRLLVRIGEREQAARAALAEGLKSFTDRLGLSSTHATFITAEEAKLLQAHGYLLRHDQQFHFFSQGFRDYADFLDSLASRKRKALRKERRQALENGITIHWLTGSDLTEKVWDDFFAFYLDTGSRKWGRPYLNRDFFSLIGQRMADDVLLVMARRGDRYIAGALNFIGTDALYGRNWGCIEDHPFLHFEVCYHQAIDFALERGLKRVEAGAQGQHKLARGYEPVTTYSAHHIAHPGLRQAVAGYLEHERDEVEEIRDLLKAHTPFRRGARE
ncbi:GNAT family N-acetyltransferase [Nitratireductor basaltis]|uniref:GNAT family N-acetyltransferase n=1 Tax=Nitratireductor basaltis TaxID=472175 RepID=A0A084UB60_9HYPH|nr:GNAT family N-acetyltransferase [Nitratireductor basaltis]KFB10196.1 hypothetical protein EL18_01226 [Nitratireductor basaltis]